MFVSISDLVKSLDLNLNSLEIELDATEEAEHSLKFNFEINPEEFLDFAIKDIEKAGKHGLVNALSNAKRAIDCQIDGILMCFGIDPKETGKILKRLDVEKIDDLPTRLHLLQEMGIIGSGIIRKIRQKRNYLEHEYKCPDQQEVEDAVEIAQLFIDASNNILQHFADFAVYDRSNPKKHKILFTLYDGNKNCLSLTGIPDMENDNVYSETRLEGEHIVIAARLAIALRTNRKVEQATHSFIKMLGSVSSSSQK